MFPLYGASQTRAACDAPSTPRRQSPDAGTVSAPQRKTHEGEQSRERTAGIALKTPPFLPEVARRDAFQWSDGGEPRLHCASTPPPAASGKPRFPQ